MLLAIALDNEGVEVANNTFVRSIFGPKPNNTQYSSIVCLNSFKAVSHSVTPSDSAQEETF